MSAHLLYGFEIFRLKYYGVNVFLCVGEVDDDYVYLYELELAKVKNKEDTYKLVYNKQNRRFKGKKVEDCLIVPKTSKGNSFFSKSLKTEPLLIRDKPFIQIKIERYSPIYNEAIKIGKYRDYEIMPGIFKAKLICDGTAEEMTKLIHTEFYIPVTSEEEFIFSEA